MGVFERDYRVRARMRNRVLAEMCAVRRGDALVRDRVLRAGVSLATGRKVVRCFDRFRVGGSKMGVGPLSIDAATLGSELV